MKEKRLMEKEIENMRAQLAKTLSVSGEMDEMRRSVERSERQRAQLSDHIEVHR